MIRTGLDSSKENILTAKSPRDTQVAAGARFFHRPFVKRISALFVVLLAVSLPYFQLTKAYFVGYDDFNEFRRTVFVDTRQPSKIFTTGHSAVKYRPLNRAINYVFYYIGHGRPGIFRTRNVVFHLLNTALLFSLGILLFDSIFIAALGAALFGLNPLAHQSVAGAIWTNTAAESMLLIAVVLGLWSYRAREHQLRWLILAIVIAWIGVLTYEADVAALGILFLYFALDSLFLRRLRVRKSWVWTLLVLSTSVAASLIGLRALVLTGKHMPIVSFATIARSAAMYVIALLLPVDSLLAKEALRRCVIL